MDTPIWYFSQWISPLVLKKLERQSNKRAMVQGFHRIFMKILEFLKIPRVFTGMFMKTIGFFTKVFMKPYGFHKDLCKKA